jgi:hypothetical protein
MFPIRSLDAIGIFLSKSSNAESCTSPSLLRRS